EAGIGTAPVLLLRGIAMTRTTRVAAGAGDNIRRSTNSGASWSITTTGYTLRDVCIVPGTREVWVVGDRSSVSSSTVFYSSDAGVNWMTGASPGSEDFSAVRFVNSQYGYIGSSTLGRVYRTTNGGISWTNTSTPPPMVRVFDLAFKDSVTGHAVGESRIDGRISFTTNAGTNWAGQAPSLIPFLRGIAYYPPDPNDRTVVGDSGAILHTTNLGSTWIRRSSGTTRDLEGVAYASALHVYAVGDLGTIVRSTDGGAMWSQQPSGVTNTLYDVAFISRDTGFVVGNSGLILATTTGGVVAVPEEIGSAVPESYALMQNYPNPFNPTTHFGFRIADFGFVSLKVFDVLGRDVATLINGSMHSGTHSVLFDSGNLPSGVYLYRLTVGGFAEVKKMAVVR
ncbi:MAG: YCF48-related protein, partial [Bacteroidota bacterium]